MKLLLSKYIKSHRFLWLCSIAGFGKSHSVRSLFEQWEGPKLFLDAKEAINLADFANFCQQYDHETSLIVIDHIEQFQEYKSRELLKMSPKFAKVVVASRALPYYLDLLNSGAKAWHILTHEHLRFSYSELEEFLSEKKRADLTSPVYKASLGWPVAISVLGARDLRDVDAINIEHYFNKPPNSLVNYVYAFLMDEAIPARRFMAWLSVTCSLNSEILNSSEKILFEDFCLNHIDGLCSSVNTTYYLNPILKFSAFIVFNRFHRDELIEVTRELADKFSLSGDVYSAISIMMKIDRKTDAVRYLDKMGGLLEWFSHGVTNLAKLKEAFSEEDINSYEMVAWLFCMVNYKSGKVGKARTILNKYLFKESDNALEWEIINCVIEFHEGLSLNLTKLNILQTSIKQSSQSSSYLNAIVSNMRALELLRSGENKLARKAIVESQLFFETLNDVRYGLTFLKIHKCHSLILSLELHSANSQANSLKSIIYANFTNDDSIKVTLSIVKIEHAFLTGTFPTINMVDRAIKQLHKSESWFDLYATIYPIAIKLAILNKKYELVRSWFYLAIDHLKNNQMKYLHQLLVKLGQYYCLHVPNQKLEFLDLEVNNKIENFQELPWRLQLVQFEVLAKSAIPIEKYLKRAIERSKLQNNMLYHYQLRLLLDICKQKSVSNSLVYHLSKLNLLAPIWQYRQYISPDNIFPESLSRFGKKHLPGNPTQLDKNALTNKETKVMEYVANGLRNKHIALEMAVSEQTVKFHLKNIFKKLGVKSRKDAVSKFISKISESANKA